jgi:phosphohistidine swiveling domain-containing protein
LDIYYYIIKDVLLLLLMSKLTNKQLKEFVQSGYKKKQDAQQVGDYMLDKDISSQRSKIYYNPETKKAVHTIAGTDRLTDWGNNLFIPAHLHQLTGRYKQAEKKQKEATSKYGKKNVSLITHSQSGNIADNLTRRGLVKGDENITLNPAIIGTHDKKIKVVKSWIDPVSLLTLTNKDDVILKPRSFNPIREHGATILEGRNIINNLKTKKHINDNMKEDYETDSDDEDEITEDTLIRDITKLSHDIHMFFKTKKPSGKVIKGMGILVEGVDTGTMSGRGQTASSTGNKDVDAFNDWSKAIGNKFKPLNKNLSPVKHAMSDAAVRIIKQRTSGGRSKKNQALTVLKKDVPEIVNIYKGLGKKGKGLYAGGELDGEGLYVANRAGRGLYASGGAVGRPVKGSLEAKAWGEKMRAARMAKM